MSKPDHDTMMRLIRQHFNEEAQQLLTFTRWKDGIDVQYPTYAIEAFYEDVRLETIEECARAARQIDRTGHEWVRNSLWDNITARAAMAVRALT